MYLYQLLSAYVTTDVIKWNSQTSVNFTNTVHIRFSVNLPYESFEINCF